MNRSAIYKKPSLGYFLKNKVLNIQKKKPTPKYKFTLIKDIYMYDP